MSTLQRLALALVVLLTGLAAGLQMLMLMGVLPALRRMPVATYAGAWQAIDFFMAARMPIFVNTMFVLYLLAMLSLLRTRPRSLMWSLLGCFALVLSDTILTVTQQLPINRAVQALQLPLAGDLSRVEALREATITHFYLRAGLSIAAFVWLVFAVIFSLAPLKQGGLRNESA